MTKRPAIAAGLFAAAASLVADWSASGDVAFRIAKGWIIGAGYRTLDVDYCKTGQFGILQRTVWDLSYSGPRMWIVYTWSRDEARFDSPSRPVIYSKQPFPGNS